MSETELTTKMINLANDYGNTKLSEGYSNGYQRALVDKSKMKQNIRNTLVEDFKKNLDHLQDEIYATRQLKQGINTHVDDWQFQIVLLREEIHKHAKQHRPKIAG